MNVAYHADDDVRNAIVSLGRTEDICFSPDGSRLAIAGYHDNSVVVLDVSVEVAGSGPYRVNFLRALKIRSPALDHPHGIAWIDDETIVVANRQSSAPIFMVRKGVNENELSLEPAAVLGSSISDHVTTPGSVAARAVGDRLFEILICNNYSHVVTRHLIDAAAGMRVLSSEIALREGLQIPDGIAFSRTGRWVAVSNHVDHTVRIYDSDRLETIGRHASLQAPAIRMASAFLRTNAQSLSPTQARPWSASFTSRGDIGRACASLTTASSWSTRRRSGVAT